MPEPEPADMHAVRDRLLSHADRFAATSAENRAKLQRAAQNWPSGSESGKALQQMIERFSADDREFVARARNLAHTYP